MIPMMKCGCAAQGVRTFKDGVKYDPPIPVCITHGCTDIADSPDLSGRTARCTYFGKMKPNRRYCNDECNYGCRKEPICKCGNEPSRVGLAFFKHQPDKPQDEFYCGCFGWD